MPQQNSLWKFKGDKISHQQDTENHQPSPNEFSGTWSFVLRIALVLLSLFVLFSLSFYITTFFYHWVGNQPRQYFVQMTSVGIAMLLLAATGLFIGRMVEPRQRVFWQSLIDAFRQMAQGNFNIHLDVGMVKEPGGRAHPVRQLVYSINDMAQELAKVEEMRQEFISNVSHEIQSPLTAILGFVEALKSEELTLEDKQHYLNIIETESKRMSRLSENLLKLTSLESGSHPFHPESFRLDRQIRDVVLLLEPLWMKNEIQVELSLQNTVISADKDLLSQVWINLLTNAMKFTVPGGSVFISLHVEDGWAAVCVRDTGIGIHEEDRQRVFERFFKADKSRQRREAGSGLGLTIVKKIVDLHDGEIHVESYVGTGTTFTVRLPKTSL